MPNVGRPIFLSLLSSVPFITYSLLQYFTYHRHGTSEIPQELSETRLSEEIPWLVNGDLHPSCGHGFGHRTIDVGARCPWRAGFDDPAECRKAQDFFKQQGFPGWKTGNGAPGSTFPCSMFTPKGEVAICRNWANLTNFKQYWSKDENKMYHTGALHARWQKQFSRWRDERWLNPMKMAKVGASIAVHPPKFYAASFFLADWASCDAARENLAVFLVFSSTDDLELFKRAQECMNPGLPHGLWTPVVSNKLLRGDDQSISAFKKWLGIANMMDILDSPLEYGLMLDSELVLYSTTEAVDRSSDCASNGFWANIFDRIRAFDQNKFFPVARVSPNLSTYTFGHNFVMSGQTYDRELIKENFDFVTRHGEVCKSTNCSTLRKQQEDCLFSWWTDIPWLNLQVTKKLFLHLAKLTDPPTGSEPWKNLAKTLSFVRFEYLTYQQFCVLFMGFRFNDVTHLSGEAKWGSYMEDPQDIARLDLIAPPPLWVSEQSADLIRKKGLNMSRESPPLLIFHADHRGCKLVPDLCKEKQMWTRLLPDFLAEQKRTDFSKLD